MATAGSNAALHLLMHAPRLPCTLACMPDIRHAPSLTKSCLQEEALSQVQAILGCSTTVARALLIYFSWDAEAVLGAPCWVGCVVLPHAAALDAALLPSAAQRRGCQSPGGARSRAAPPAGLICAANHVALCCPSPLNRHHCGARPGGGLQAGGAAEPGRSIHIRGCRARRPGSLSLGRAAFPPSLRSCMLAAPEAWRPCAWCRRGLPTVAVVLL